MGHNVTPSPHLHINKTAAKGAYFIQQRLFVNGQLAQSDEI